MMPENNALCLGVSADTPPESILIDYARGESKSVYTLSDKGPTSRPADRLP